LPEQPRKLQLGFVREGDAFSIAISSRDAKSSTDPWTLHATLRLIADVAEHDGASVESVLPPPGAELCDGRAHYRLMKEGGLAYGPRFQGLAEVHCGDHEALGRLRTLTELELDGECHAFHPALWDAAHQALAALLTRQGGSASQPYTWIPVGIERITVFGTPLPSEPLWVRARARTEPDGDSAHGDLAIYDRSGRVVIEVQALRLLRRDADHLDDVGQWFFRSALREAPVCPEVPSDGAWIVLGEPDAVQAQLIAELHQRGVTIVQAVPASSWAGPVDLADPERAVFRLSLSDPEQLRRLMEQVSAVWPLCGVVNLRPYQAARLAGGVLGDVRADDKVISALFLEILYQARVLQGVSRRDPPPRLVLVSGGSEGPDADPDLVAAPLQGLARVIATELPQLRCVQVQLGGQDLATEAREPARELHASDDEDEVVLRGGGRHVRRLERVSTARPARSTMAVRADATYLVTGGLGGLGLVFANWLADRGATHLILVGRRPPSPQARQQIESLRARGQVSQVIVRELDITQAGPVAALFEEIDGRFPPLRGVLHLAGVLDDATLFQQNEQRLASVFGPKVIGTQLLHEQTRARALDFFVLFSGAATLLGTPGQANYAAANAFMDAFARYRRRMGLPALSINWGIWDEVGLAAATAQRGQRLQDQGLVAIRPTLGVLAFEIALSLASENVAILPIRLARWLAHNPGLTRSSLFKDLARSMIVPDDEVAASVTEQLRAIVDPREQREHLRRWVERQMAAVLRRDPASMQRHENFSAMGVDSLMALDFRNRLERSLRVRLPPTMVFNHPNLEALSVFLETKLAPGTISEPAPPVSAGGVRSAASPIGRVGERDGAALLGALSQFKSLTQPA